MLVMTSCTCACFSSDKLMTEKNERFLSNINLGETIRLNLDKFGIGNDVPDRRSATFHPIRKKYRPTGLDLI